MLQKLSITTIISVLAFSVSGCLGSGSSSNDVGTDVSRRLVSAGPDPSTGGDALAKVRDEIQEAMAGGSFNQLTIAGQTTANEIVEVANLAPATNLPATASYSGSFVVADQDEGELTGDMRLNVSFDDGVLTGRMNRMVYTEFGFSEDVEGSLDIGGAVEDANVAGNIRGNIVTAEGDYDVTGEMAGQFRTNEAIRGAGSLDLAGTSDGLPDIEANGGWAVTQD